MALLGVRARFASDLGVTGSRYASGLYASVDPPFGMCQRMLTLDSHSISYCVLQPPQVSPQQPDSDSGRHSVHSPRSLFHFPLFFVFFKYGV